MLSQIDYTKNHEEMQAIFSEKYRDLAKRVEKKNKTAGRYKQALTDKQFERFIECGSLIGLSPDEEIVQANFCKLRACPVCNKRNSAKKWHTVKRIAESLNMTINPKWLFLTLTVKNVQDYQLKECIIDLMKSINRLFSRKTWQKRVLGFFRSLEITYNAKENTYHPHYHILLVVPEDYFTNENIYLATYQWRKMWEQSANLDYVAQVDIREIKADTDKDLSGAIAEVAKYAVKMAEVAKSSSEALKTILSAIKSRRLISYGGIIHEVYDSLNVQSEAFKQSMHEIRVDGQIKYYELSEGRYKLK